MVQTQRHHPRRPRRPTLLAPPRRGPSTPHHHHPHPRTLHPHPRPRRPPPPTRTPTPERHIPRSSHPDRHRNRAPRSRTTSTIPTASAIFPAPWQRRRVNAPRINTTRAINAPRQHPPRTNTRPPPSRLDPGPPPDQPRTTLLTLPTLSPMLSRVAPQRGDGVLCARSEEATRAGR